VHALIAAKLLDVNAAQVMVKQPAADNKQLQVIFANNVQSSSYLVVKKW
jgi:hypothetical protein